MIRVLCRLLETSCNHIKRIVIINQLNIIPSLLKLIDGKHSYSIIIVIEIIELIVNSIRKSTRLLSVLYDAYNQYDGNNILINNLILLFYAYDIFLYFFISKIK